MDIVYFASIYSIPYLSHQLTSPICLSRDSRAPTVGSPSLESHPYCWLRLLDGESVFRSLHPSRNTLLGLDLFSISPDGLEPFLLFSPPNGQAGRTRQRRPSIRDIHILLSLIWGAARPLPNIRCNIILTVRASSSILSWPILRCRGCWSGCDPSSSQNSA